MVGTYGQTIIVVGLLCVTHVENYKIKVQNLP